MKNIIKNYADSMYPDMLNFCKRIIQTPSLSGKESEVSKLFVEEMNKLNYDEVFVDAWGNAIGIIKGTKPGPTIMFNGHMDTVDTGDYDTWEGYDPYGAEVDVSTIDNPFTHTEDLTDVIHGRGSGDLKCNLASQVYAGGILAKLKSDGVDFAGIFLLTAVVLEENGEMMGTIKLCNETLPAKDIDVDAMICCEPSSMRVMLGHRGRMEIKVIVYGQSCHGSSPWLGVNAVEKSAELIRAVHQMMSSKEDFHPDLGRPGIALTMYNCEPNELCVVPNKCTIVYDRRLIPGETPEGAIKEIQDIVDKLSAEDPEFKANVTINKNIRTAFTGLSEEIESSKEVWIINKEHPFVAACSDALYELDYPVVYDYWSFSTDTPQLGTRMNKPVIGFGPGQEYLIHTPHEMVRLDFLKNSLSAYANMFIKTSQLPLSSFVTE
ncbi:MAG: M20/M25/M40 family metallo-hydrolase [Bacillota bacterium]|nr:M20/M25/M40 family metallo-hydrolase [Bacillota bacterium]